MAGFILTMDRINDRVGKELKLGDPVAFAAGGWIEKGYIYKIDLVQIYVTNEPRDQRPTPTGFMPHARANIRILKL